MRIEAIEQQRDRAFLAEYEKLVERHGRRLGPQIILTAQGIRASVMVERLK